MSNKNKGPKLYFSQYGGEQPIPPEFIAAMERAEEIQKVPNDVGPETLSDTIIESKVETDQTGERQRKTVKKKSGNIILSAIRTNDQGQPVQVTRTLYPTGTTPATPSATQSVAVHDLGNGWSIQEVGVEGTYVDGTFTPGVFSGSVFERELPITIPERFRDTNSVITTRTDESGTAVDPTLSGNEVKETQEQLTINKKRTTIVTYAPTVPQTRNGQDLERQGFVLPYEDRLENSGASLGNANTSVTPLSSSKDNAKEYDTSGLLTYSKIFVGMTRLEVPPVLTDLDPFFDYREGAGDFTSSVGDCHWDVAGSWSYSLRGEGQGSAAVVAHVKHSVQQKWGGYTKTQRVVFFLTPPVIASDITTKLTALLGSTVAFMPSFDPTSISVLLVSNAVSLRAEAQEHVQDGGSGATAEEHSEYGGSGSSREHSLTIESLNIPPTLHSSVSGTSSDGFSLGASASADAGSESSSPGSEAVSASVEITGPASSPTALPTGLHIVALDSEIFYDKIMYHAEVVNM
jgi:hypothetical protein